MHSEGKGKSRERERKRAVFTGQLTSVDILIVWITYVACADYVTRWDDERI